MFIKNISLSRFSRTVVRRQLMRQQQQRGRAMIPFSTLLIFFNLNQTTQLFWLPCGCPTSSLRSSHVNAPKHNEKCPAYLHFTLAEREAKQRTSEANRWLWINRPICSRYATARRVRISLARKTPRARQRAPKQYRRLRQLPTCKPRGIFRG